MVKKVFRGEFTDSATADWHYLPFKVPRGVRKLHVSYEHEPTDTGIGLSYNVVDIGIFDPSGHGLGSAEGFRGWSGGARKEFHIKTGRATPGYIAGPLTPGRWHILLGPYLITPPGTPYTVTVKMFLGPKGEPFEPAPAPQAVPGTGPGWYRGDLHLHTVHSDGSAQPAPAARSGESGRAGLHRLLRSQHQLRDVRLGAARGRRLPRHERRGGDHPQRALAGDGPATDDLDRLALPGRGRRAAPLRRPGPRARRDRHRLPPEQPHLEHQVGPRLRPHRCHRGLERALDGGRREDGQGLERPARRGHLHPHRGQLRLPQRQPGRRARPVLLPATDPVVRRGRRPRSGVGTAGSPSRPPSTSPSPQPWATPSPSAATTWTPRRRTSSW